MQDQPTASDRQPAIDLHGLVGELFPINRSLTGAGVRETLQIVASHIDLAINEVATGTAVLDWHVPMEWNIRSGTITSMSGRRLVDFADNNLHVLGYSKPVSAVLSRDELAQHVHTLPDQPDLIPYRTGYFADNWGFCLPHNLWQSMTDEAYRVEIDSDIAPGSLTYGEFFVPGETPHEVLLTCHICHPSLADDNLSGIAIATALAMRQAAPAAAAGIPLPLSSGHDRGHHMAGPQPVAARHHQAWSRSDLPRRCQRLSLQAEPQRARSSIVRWRMS